LWRVSIFLNQMPTKVPIEGYKEAGGMCHGTICAAACLYYLGAVLTTLLDGEVCLLHIWSSERGAALFSSNGRKCCTGDNGIGSGYVRLR
jgi:hypothetical protein